MPFSCNHPAQENISRGSTFRLTRILECPSALCSTLLLNYCKVFSCQESKGSFGQTTWPATQMEAGASDVLSVTFWKFFVCIETMCAFFYCHWDLFLQSMSAIRANFENGRDNWLDLCNKKCCKTPRRNKVTWRLKSCSFDVGSCKGRTAKVWRNGGGHFEIQ